MRINLTVSARTVVLAVAAMLVAATGGYAVASTTGGGAVSACAKKSNGALRLAARCSKSERRVTWAVQGPAGAPGSPGAPGQNGLDLFARVDDTGVLHQHSAGVSVTKLSAGPGQYEVTFPRDVSACAAVASEGTNANNSSTKGALFEAVEEGDFPSFDPHKVLVLATTYNVGTDTLADVDAGFNLVVAC